MDRTTWGTIFGVTGAMLLLACGRRDATPLLGGAPSVEVCPKRAQVLPGGSVSFAAAVTGPSGASVTWAVLEATGCGSISSTGAYAAPSSVAICHVRATRDGNDSVADTATVEVTDAIGPAWRPFGADSPWNTPIAANPEIEPDSAGLIADFIGSSPWGPHLDVNIPEYSIPLYWADASTTSYRVLADYGGDGWSGNDGANASGMMPIPAGAAPDSAADHHLLVIDLERNLEWGCWNMSGQDGQWRAGLCATADLSGSGVRPPATVAPWNRAAGARACGFPLIAGLIRAEEIQAGRIDHALVVAYPHVRAGYFTPPASTWQGANGAGAVSSRGIPCGGRIQFDPTVDIDALPLGRSGRIIMRALQEYGAYVGDASGALSLYAENAPAAQAYFANGVLDMYELNGKIDLTRFRVIRIALLYGNGSG